MGMGMAVIMAETSTLGRWQVQRVGSTQWEDLATEAGSDQVQIPDGLNVDHTYR